VPLMEETEQTTSTKSWFWKWFLNNKLVSTLLVILLLLINIFVGVIWMFYSGTFNSEYFAVGFFWGMIILFILRKTFAKSFLENSFK